MGCGTSVLHLMFYMNRQLSGLRISLTGRYLIYDIQEEFMDNIYVNYLLTALILTFAIPVAGFVIEQLVKILYSVTAAFLGGSFTYFIFNRLTFIGVFHHELSHALLATVTGAKVTKIVFFHPDGDRLGYVEYVTRGNIIMRSVQQTMASIAPVFCGALTSAGIYYYLTVYGAALVAWQMVLLWYAFISIILHMTMSSQDFKVMWRGIPVVYIIIFVIVYICKFNIF